MRILVYENQYTSAQDAEVVDLNWEEFRDDILRKPEIVTSKGSETQYFPGTMIEGARTKGDSSVDRVHLYCLDADGITDEQLESIRQIVKDEGLEAALHSTYSHLKQRKEDGTNRVRVIFPLSRPVLAGEWRIFWSNMRILLGNVADQTTASPSKHYLVPSLPPGEEAAAARLYEEFSGEPIDVDSMFSRFGIEYIAGAEVDDFDVGKQRISDEMFMEVVMRRRRGDEAKVASALKSALAKQSYAERGSREAMLFAIAGMLAREFPRGNPDDICEPLRFSVEFEEKQGGPKFLEFKDKVVRRQRDILHRAAVKQLEAAKEAAKIAGKKDSVEDFSEESLKPHLDRVGNKITFKDLKQSLVLVYQNGFFVFNGAGYSYATSLSLLAQIRACLMFRAETHLDFSYFFPSDEGKPPTEKTADTFVRDHGCVIDRVRYTYSGASYFDPSDRTLWLSEVESPQRLVPERCEKVEKWMLAFCGGDKSMLRKWEQWLSQYPNVEEALVGLVLLGPSGIGKSAFAEGMSCMFGTNPYCTMKNYLSNFNSEILGNPLVFADESLPEVKGKVPTDLLRTVVSSGRHEVNRKNRPIVPLEGFVRTIMAFQHLRKFDFGRGHTREDVEAIQKRYLFLMGHAEAAELFDYELFVKQRAIAKHAMHLARTLSRSDPRFGVDTSGCSAVLAGDPVAMAILDWLGEYLFARAPFAADPISSARRLPALVNKGRVLVDITALRRNWDDYAPGQTRRGIGQQELAIAVKALSGRKTAIRVKTSGGSNLSLWLIPTDAICRRLQDVDFVDAEAFEHLLKIPHEVDFSPASFRITEEERCERTCAQRALGVRPAKEGM